MDPLESDFPENEHWIEEQREQVVAYLSQIQLPCGKLARDPVWDVYPATSIWAVESLRNPGWVGWWVICGNHPTDYVSAKCVLDPREALSHFVHRWLEVSDFMIQGKSHPLFRYCEASESYQKGLALKDIARDLQKWVQDDSEWTWMKEFQEEREMEDEIDPDEDDWNCR